MCIEKDEIMNRRARFLARKIFINNLAIMVVWGYFSDFVYKYARPGYLYDWIFVFKVTRSASYGIQIVIEAIAYADHQAPILLSRK